MEVDVELEMPVTEQEKNLAGIWATLLNVDIQKIGRHTSFFELGGDSISAIQLVSMAEKLDMVLTSSNILKNVTLSRIAKTASVSNADEQIPSYHISTDVEDELTSIMGSLVGMDIFPCSALQKGMIVAGQMDRTSYVQQSTWDLKGIHLI